MTDRISSLLVVLADDFREDDAQALMDAIGLLRGVIRVTGNVVDPRDHVARVRANRRLYEEAIGALTNNLEHE